MKNSENNPLVSIVVITYNSSKFVLETLESAKAQTYQNIELIVSDDCSTDDTVEICRNWIANNEDRFVRTELITVEKNTGISANCNRGCKVAKGEWIKIFAGDDALENNYTKEVVDYLISNKDILCLFTNVTVYNEIFDEKNIYEKTDKRKHRMFANPNLIAKEQFEIYLHNKCYSIGMIINRTVFDMIGFFDEKYLFCDDTPFMYKILSHNIKVYLYEIYGAKYRLRLDSVREAGKKNNWATKSGYSSNLADLDVALPYYSFTERCLRYYVLKVRLLFYSWFDDKTNVITGILLRCLIAIPGRMINKYNKKYL